MRFENRTAIITGAASGMGLVTAQQMAQEGAVVYMVDINEERLQQEAAAIQEAGGKAVPCVCDIRDYDQICAVVEQCVSDHGHVDCVINFAGGFPARMCGLKDGLFIHEPLVWFIICSMAARANRMGARKLTAMPQSSTSSGS